mmetsp:Transcript_38570/g.96269  ORF Transcript_38570/g.96269 Transcript_38570/m.96269 type:complete len:245 (+) Transcript_38570:283-1017(+)
MCLPERTTIARQSGEFSLVPAPRARDANAAGHRAATFASPVAARPAGRRAPQPKRCRDGVHATPAACLTRRGVLCGGLARLHRRPKLLLDLLELLLPRHLVLHHVVRRRLGLLLLLLAQLLGAHLEVLLALRLALEHLRDGDLLVRLHDHEGLAQLEQVDGAVDRARGEVLALLLHVDREEAVVVHLQRECGVVLLVVVVPHVERAVHLGRDEDARPGGRPPRVEHVVLGVLGGHDRVADLLVP